MNRLTLAILASAVAMFTTLMIFDVYQLITTPLSPLGINHWIPEYNWINFKNRSRVNKIYLRCSLL